MNAISRLPSAVVVWMADAWLLDGDAIALARSCTAMIGAMQRYKWKQYVPVLHAVGIPPAPSASPDDPSADSTSVGPRHRFGLVQRVLIPSENEVPLAQLPGLLCRLPSTAVDVRFSSQWTAAVESLMLPASVRSIHLGGRFEQPISAWRLPAALTELTLSTFFNQPLDGLQLPAALRRLCFGDVFGRFSHSLAALSLPRGLEELRLSSSWNRPLSDLPALPPSLLLLDLGECFNHPLETLQQPWPPQLRTLLFGSSFKQPLQLPDTITQLRLGYEWNHSLDGVHLPRALTSLTIAGQSFKHSLNGVAWPAGLLSLTLPNEWNQPVAGLRLPPSLTQLSFGSKFCQSLRDWDPPPSLTDLALPDYGGFGNANRHQAADLRLPPLLKRMPLPWLWAVDLADLTLPTGLQSLTLGRQTRIADPARVRFPAALTELELGTCALSSLAGFAWPPGLTHLCTGSFASPLLDWTPPASLTRLDVGTTDPWRLPGSQLLLPPALTDLRLRVNRSPSRPLSFGSTDNAEGPAPLAGLVLPLSLRRLAVSADWPDPLSGVTLPPQLEAIELEARNKLSLEGLQLPDSLRELRLLGELPQSLVSLRLPASLRVLAVLDHVDRAPSDLPLTVPPQLRVLEIGASKACDMWREWIASSPQVDQRGCVVAVHA